LHHHTDALPGFLSSELVCRLSKSLRAIRLGDDKTELSPYPNQEAHMPKTILISLPVTNLAASTKFYKAIGFTHNPQFSGEASAHMTWSDTISIMLLTHAMWKTLTTRPIAPSNSSQVSLMLSCDDRAQVDAMSKAAGASGGTEDVNPIQDEGSMYGRDMMDPDGHIWGALWMDPAAMSPPQQ
jgi:uncharacterized protein